MSAKPIVAATDGSEESLRAVDWAAREAVLRGAALRIVAPAPLCAVGVVSYGVFLYHQLAIGVVGAALPGEGWGCLAVNGALALALSLAAGAASWVVVERPMMRRVRRA